MNMANKNGKKVMAHQSFQRLDLFKLPKGFRGQPAWLVQLWWLIQGSLFAWSPQFMYGWRRFLLRSFGAKVGIKALIRPTARITYPWKVSIGAHSWIGDDVVLYSLGEIEIGDDVVISQRSYLCAGSHDYTKPTFDIFTKKILIASEVWVASDVYIFPGVTIERGAVVGARSSVFQDLPGNTVCYGNPAKPQYIRVDLPVL